MEPPAAPVTDAAAAQEANNDDDDHASNSTAASQSESSPSPVLHSSITKGISGVHLVGSALDMDKAAADARSLTKMGLVSALVC